MKLTANIDLREVVPKSFWEAKKHRAVRFVDAGLVMAAQWMMRRYKWDSIMINDWMYGGQSEQRGLRIPGQKLYRGDGAHDTGRALDIIPRRGDENARDLVAEFHEHAATYPRLYFANNIWRIETIQLAPTWIHIDSIIWPDQKEVAFIDMTTRYSPQVYMEMMKKDGIC